MEHTYGMPWKPDNGRRTKLRKNHTKDGASCRPTFQRRSTRNSHDEKSKLYAATAGNFRFTLLAKDWGSIPSNDFYISAGFLRHS
eukprot:g16761.t1